MNSSSLDKAELSVKKLMSLLSMTKEFYQELQKKLGGLVRESQNKESPIDVAHSPESFQYQDVFDSLMVANLKCLRKSKKLKTEGQLWDVVLALGR